MAGSLFDQVLNSVSAPSRKVVTGTSGGGAVTIQLNGMSNVERVTIAPEAAEDVEALQELVAAALNDALQKATDGARSEAMQLLQQLAPQ
jgi:DNA-binding YbaB/EbfC family protein